MADILIVTASTTDTAATNVAAVYTNAGDNVTLIDQNAATLAQMTGSDLVLAPRVADNTAIASLLLDANNAGTPVMSGTYTAYSGSSWEIQKGLFASATTENNQNSIIVTSTEDGFYPATATTQVYNNSNFMFSFNSVDPAARTIANFSGRTIVATFDVGDTLANDSVVNARTIINGVLYGRGGFTQTQIDAMIAMRDWLVTPPVPLVTITGTVVDGNTPLERNIKAFNQSTNALFATTRSAANGAYTLEVEADTDYYIVCDDEGSDPRNSLIFSGVRGV